MAQSDFPQWTTWGAQTNGIKLFPSFLTYISAANSQQAFKSAKNGWGQWGAMFPERTKRVRKDWGRECGGSCLSSERSERGRVSQEGVAVLG